MKKRDISLLIFDFDGVMAESNMHEKLNSYDFTRDPLITDLVMKNVPDRELAKCMSDIMFRVSRPSYIVYTWVGIILPILASKVKLAICSNNCRKNIFYALGGVMNHFSCVKTWESVDMGNLKPHPQGLNDIVREMNIEDPSRVLLVGDTKVDVLAAKNAGIQIALAFWGQQSDCQYDKNNDLHLLNPEMLLKLIP